MLFTAISFYVPVTRADQQTCSVSMAAAKNIDAAKEKYGL
jgi:hypothetical protein